MHLSSIRPQYAIPRIARAWFERRNPDVPWLSPGAILLLDNWLKSSDRGMEWGSGRSTMWFAKRVEHVLSVEDNQQWHGIVHEKLAGAGVSGKVDQRFVACELGDHEEVTSHPYINVATELADSSLDFSLVDGKLRYGCLLAVLPKIKVGGLLILDNANRYVPNRFLGGHSTVHFPRNEPYSPAWAALLEKLAAWRSINTTDRIWDTRFWVRT
jgi:hypothetical protein